MLTRKSNFIFLTGILIIIFESMSGFLRYYFDVVGLTPVIYLPKIFCCILVFGEFYRFNKSSSIIILSIILLASSIGMYNGARFENIGFAFMVLSPFLLGLIYGKYFELYSNKFLKYVLICFILSVFGAYLDQSLTVPWKGFSYKLGEISVEGNRKWENFEIDRIAGFSRINSSLAIILSVLSLYLISYNFSRFYKIIIIAVTLHCIYLTTNKASLISYIVVCVFYFLFRKLRIFRFGSGFIVILGILMPFFAWLNRNFSILERVSDSKQAEFVTSYEDRIRTTWPSAFYIVFDSDFSLLGTGIGTVGNTVQKYPIHTIKGKLLPTLEYTDNTALYLFGMFGILGLAIYYILFPLGKSLKNVNSNHALGLSAVLYCLCLTSWTSDIFESLFSSFFWGICVSQAYQNNLANIIKV